MQKADTLHLELHKIERTLYNKRGNHCTKEKSYGNRKKSYTRLISYVFVCSYVCVTVCLYVCLCVCLCVYLCVSVSLCINSVKKDSFKSELGPLSKSKERRKKCLRNIETKCLLSIVIELTKIQITLIYFTPVRVLKQCTTHAGVKEAGETGIIHTVVIL